MTHHKLLIVTTDRNLPNWRSLLWKLHAIRVALNNTPHATWQIDVRHQEVRPVVKDGRITHAWFDTFSHPIFREGYHHVFLHFPKRDWRRLKLKRSVRGRNQIDQDFVGECYGWADEDSLREGLDQFVQVVLHEMSHELARSTGSKDETHPYHDQHPDIAGIFARYDMRRWQPRYQDGMRRVADLQAQLETMETSLHPVPLPYRTRITQGYGVPNFIYKKTGRHIGTDYAMPVGTPLSAPLRCEVTAAGKHPELGYYCHVQYTEEGEVYEERWSHLREAPRLGTYERGSVIAYSGNTGLSTGPHLHREKWRGDVRVDLITKQNWAALTLDPETII